MTDGFTLAVSSEMVFLDLPHLDRVKRLHDAGFAVEIWDWTRRTWSPSPGPAPSSRR